MGTEYSMRDLQRYLEVHNFPTILLDGCLSYQDKVHVSFEKPKNSESKNGKARD